MSCAAVIHDGIADGEMPHAVILANMMSSRGAKRFALALDGDTIEIATSLWRGGSIRKIRAIIERLLARRAEQAPRK